MDKNNQKPSGFTYTYSAREQAELRRIRDKYTAPTEAEGKMARLRRLDASVTQIAQAVSLIFGVIGMLVFGFGISLCIADLKELLGLSGTVAMVIGIIAGVIGGILAGLAYPVYNAIVKARRKKLAPEILRLTDELIK